MVVFLGVHTIYQANATQINTINTLTLQRDQAVAQLGNCNDALEDQLQDAKRAYATQGVKIRTLTEEKEKDNIYIDTLEDQLHEPNEPMSPKSTTFVLLLRKRRRP